MVFSCMYPILLCFSGYPRFSLSAMVLPPNLADNRCSTVLLAAIQRLVENMLRRVHAVIASRGGLPTIDFQKS